MMHNRIPDDEYVKDVEEARRLIALNESIHNGAMRAQRGEDWYYSEDGRDFARTVTMDMGVMLTRIMSYADSLVRQRDNSAKLISGMMRWKSAVPTRRQQEGNLAAKVMYLHTEYQELMAAWADTDIMSFESDKLDDQMDIVRGQVMNLLPLIVKTLRHTEARPADQPAADKEHGWR